MLFVVVVVSGLEVVVRVVDRFLYSAILRCRADSPRLHAILHENMRLAFYSAFLNIHRSGVLTALAWLAPHETAAVSARSVYTIQPCTVSLQAKPHTSQKLTTFIHSKGAGGSACCGGEAVVLLRFLDTVEPNEEKTRPYLKAPFLLLRPFPLNLPANESQGVNESVTHGVFFSLLQSLFFL